MKKTPQRPPKDRAASVAVHRRARGGSPEAAAARPPSVRTLLADRERLAAERERLLAERDQLKAELKAERGGLRRQFQELQAAFKSMERRQHHYLNLYDFAPIGYAVLNDRGLLHEINKAGARLLGWEHARLVQRPFERFVAAEDTPVLRDHLRRCKAAQGRVSTELTLTRKDGSRFPVELISTAGCPGSDQLAQYRTAIIDITPRRQAEEALRHWQMNYQSLVDALEGVVWEGRLGDDGARHFSFVSRQAARLLGFPPDRWIQQIGLWESRLHSEDRKPVLAAGARAAAETRNYQVEYRWLDAGDQTVWIRENVTVTRGPHGRIKLQGVMVNISELKDAEKALRRAFDDLEARVQDRTLDLTNTCSELQRAIQERQRLEQEILDLTERERRRIALDLHDDLGQRLTGISLMAKTLQVKLARRSQPEAAEAAKLNEAVSEAIHRAHDLTDELAAWETQAPDLPSALVHLARRARDLFNIECRVRSLRSLPALPAPATRQLYKIAQEAVTNAIKHGRAKRVSIRLIRCGDRPAMLVENDGHPFPKLLGAPQGLGLRIMSYRASLIGASLEVRSNGQRGTTVSCVLAGRNGTGMFDGHPTAGA